MKTQKRKWYYWDIFNQCWMRNGEGVKNWRLQGFAVKLLPLLLLVLSSFVAMGQMKIDSAIAHDPKWQGIQSKTGRQLADSSTIVWGSAFAQTKPDKWEESGYSEMGDTVTKSYILKGKDSLTYSIETRNCNCDFYTTIVDHKVYSCKGLKMHAIETHFMYWYKDATFVKGIKISETKPKWDSRMSEGNTIQGEYEQNGKKVYIAKIHLLKHKLINRTKPYKFTSEWVTVSEY